MDEMLVAGVLVDVEIAGVFSLAADDAFRNRARGRFDLITVTRIGKFLLGHSAARMDPVASMQESTNPWPTGERRLLERGVLKAVDFHRSCHYCHAHLIGLGVAGDEERTCSSTVRPTTGERAGNMATEIRRRMTVECAAVAAHHTLTENFVEGWPVRESRAICPSLVSGTASEAVDGAETRGGDGV
ncbi:hypothetical protein GWK47_008415 [Chionoecetes opilio]|uniref:Uncharacterized protein n=1 Tax=Chionoecetes opilio TaxID=41210 RepID=A0A8J4XZ41_CHIOP|nr:hypothetical protein GWK47_008415 [Chionoecetes opilio]